MNGSHGTVLRYRDDESYDINLVYSCRSATDKSLKPYSLEYEKTFVMENYASVTGTYTTHDLYLFGCNDSYPAHVKLYKSGGAEREICPGLTSDNDDTSSCSSDWTLLTELHDRSWRFVHYNSPSIGKLFQL